MISIIIPVYNVEQYIESCLISIMNQTYADFEIILVNDGSTDGSLALCEKLQQHDHRIKIVSKENGGASTARNEGIKKAIGDYILFVDSDDYLESDTFLMNLQKQIDATTSDVVLFSAKDYDVKSKSMIVSRGNYNVSIIREFNLPKTLDYLIQNNLYPGAVWIFAVKASIVKQNNIYFRTNIIAEDIDWITHLFTKIDTIDAVNDAFYIYRKNQSNSVTSTAGSKGITSILDTIEDWKPKLEQQDNAIKKYLLHNLGYYFFTSLVLYANLKSSQKAFLKQRLTSNVDVTKYVMTRKLKLVRIFLRVFGLDLTSKVLGKMYKIKTQN